MISLPGCTDYITSIETPSLIKAEELQGGRVVKKNGKPLRYAGGFCMVFPYEKSSGKKVAVRCWTAHVPDAEKRSRQISQCLQKSGLPYFVEFNYVERGVATQLGVFPIIIMDWVEATPLKDYIENNINNPSAIRALADEFVKMTNELHRLGFSHGDLQHGNIMVSSTGQIFLVDYDSMFVPGLEGVTDEIKGLAGYQHPGRACLKYLSPKADYFSELIIYTSLLAFAKNPKLWTELNIDNTETLVFSQDDIENPSRSKIFSSLKSDSDLVGCVNAIETALSKTDINDLLPLSEAIVSDSERITKNVQKKWKNWSKPECSEPKINTAELKKKWEQVTQSEPETMTDVSLIISKWKK